MTTPAPPTTQAPQLHPPFEASNLINHIAKPVDVSHVRIVTVIMLVPLTNNCDIFLTVASQNGK